MTRILLTALALLVATPALCAEPAWVGRWTTIKDRTPCTQEDPSDGIPVTFSKNQLEGMEWSCDIKKSTPQGAQFIWKMSCSGEGSSWKETSRVQIDGDHMTINDGKSPVDYWRCPKTE